MRLTWNTELWSPSPNNYVSFFLIRRSSSKQSPMAHDNNWGDKMEERWNTIGIRMRCKYNKDCGPCFLFPEQSCHLIRDRCNVTWTLHLFSAGVVPTTLPLDPGLCSLALTKFPLKVFFLAKKDRSNTTFARGHIPIQIVSIFLPTLAPRNERTEKDSSVDPWQKQKEPGILRKHSGLLET